MNLPNLINSRNLFKVEKFLSLKTVREKFFLPELLYPGCKGFLFLNDLGQQKVRGVPGDLRKETKLERMDRDVPQSPNVGQNPTKLGTV